MDLGLRTGSTFLQAVDGMVSVRPPLPPLAPFNRLADQYLILPNLLGCVALCRARDGLRGKVLPEHQLEEAQAARGVRVWG